MNNKKNLLAVLLFITPLIVEASAQNQPAPSQTQCPPALQQAANASATAGAVAALLMANSHEGALASAAGNCPPGGMEVNSAPEGQMAAGAAVSPRIVVVAPAHPPKLAIHDSLEGHAILLAAAAATHAIPDPSAPQAEVNSTADDQAAQALQRDRKSKSENPHAAAAPQKKTSNPFALTHMRAARASAVQPPKIKYFIRASTLNDFALTNQKYETALQRMHDLVRATDCPEAAGVRSQYRDLPCFVVAQYWNHKNSNYLLEIHREGFKILRDYQKLKTAMKDQFPELSERDVDEQAPTIMRENLFHAFVKIDARHNIKCRQDAHATADKTRRCLQYHGCGFQKYDVPKVMWHYDLEQYLQKKHGPKDGGAKKNAAETANEIGIESVQEKEKNDGCVIA